MQSSTNFDDDEHEGGDEESGSDDDDSGREMSLLDALTDPNLQPKSPGSGFRMEKGGSRGDTRRKSSEGPSKTQTLNTGMQKAASTSAARKARSSSGSSKSPARARKVKSAEKKWLSRIKP